MKELAPLLEQLAAGLNTTAEHLWSVLVRQQFTNSLIYIVFGLVLILVWGALAWLLRTNPNAYSPDEWGFFLVVVVAIAVCLTIALCANLPTIIAGFVNPEYAALREIFAVVRKSL